MEQELFGVAMIPLISGVVEALKQLGMPVKFAAGASIALGIGAGILIFGAVQVPQAIVVGTSLGLGASGLYSGLKQSTQPTTSTTTQTEQHDI